MAPSMSKLWTMYKENPRESAFLTWIVVVLGMQQYEAFVSARRGVSKDAEHKTVSIRGKRFNMSRGAATNLGWSGVLEYWITSVVRMAEAATMFRLGEAAFAPSKAGMSVWHRTRNILWAAFAMLPVLDIVLPEDWTNPLPEDQKRYKRDTRFRMPLYVWTVAEILTTYKMIAVLSNPKSRLSALEKIGMVLTLAVFNGGIGINASHELVHKDHWFEKLCANALLVNCNYVHWGFEHTDGHHKNVATPEDPATSRLNESVYAFLPRTFIGSWISAWRIEQKRLSAEGSRSVLQNRMVWSAVLPFLWAVFIARRSGGSVPRALGYFYLQCLGAASLLEVVNYLEHYGLRREKLPDGSYERVNPTHSWNAPHRISNTFLYKLQRHSDHHTFEKRPYHLLRNFQESPQLPSGYPGLITLAFFPPLFRAVMNPLVEANNARKRDPDGEGTWQAALRTARFKMAAYSLTFGGVATAGLVYSERSRLAALARA
ncbi:Hypothetical Protein FCC1311_076992 [Hondaea fermentalgiana]|uniref:Fatty acid desaturase domain-containing protein n=1 Tax=Hondaea fermentalgiana TaxID=2315210 RepID=A0A2R5GLG5_9STRA|nr:Hypothetical Protein FCC1311_076992 [Hondaea fermentalgiana]|eukprot:GBG31475.1 Hypothetical Protein FCC1311_076992 [Hondaea fermentalgiana]